MSNFVCKVKRKEKDEYAFLLRVSSKLNEKEKELSLKHLESHVKQEEKMKENLSDQAWLDREKKISIEAERFFKKWKRKVKKKAYMKYFRLSQELEEEKSVEAFRCYENFREELNILSNLRNFVSLFEKNTKMHIFSTFPLWAKYTFCMEVLHYYTERCYDEYFKQFAHFSTMAVRAKKQRIKASKPRKRGYLEFL